MPSGRKADWLSSRKPQLGLVPDPPVGTAGQTDIVVVGGELDVDRLGGINYHARAATRFQPYWAAGFCCRFVRIP
jgi:hypothetical protein